MKTREELTGYFTELYKDNEFALKSMESKTTEELQTIYLRSVKREAAQNEILENGTITYTIDFDDNLNKEVEKFLWDNDMFTIYDGQFKYRNGNDGRLIGVPIQFIEELKKKFEVKMHRKKYILGRKDIQNLKVGDKVTVTLDGMFGAYENQGTVHSINEDEIIIRQYRSRSKGWTLEIGKEVSIERVKSFQKAS